MHCLFCNALDTKVTDSRLAGGGSQVWRRRECLTCGERFTTYETAELFMPRIVKRDGQRVQFEEQKLRLGVMRALEKRPVPSEKVEGVFQRLLRKIRSSGEREIPSLKIGEWVMEELRQLDPVAYVRFASVYRSFEDVSEFHKEIARIQEYPSSNNEGLS